MNLIQQITEILFELHCISELDIKLYWTTTGFKLFLYGFSVIMTDNNV